MPLRLQPVLPREAGHFDFALAMSEWRRPELAWTIPDRAWRTLQTWLGILVRLTSTEPSPFQTGPGRERESRGLCPVAASDETRNPHQRGKPRNPGCHTRRRSAG